MITTRLKTLLVAVCVGGSVSIAGAQTIDPIVEVGKQRAVAAKASQAKVDRLADETASLLSDYKTVMKQVDGLKVYNARLERQIANQERRIRDIDASIAEASVIQRQIPPLVVRMLDGLEQFITLDMPFDLDTRLGNIEAVRANMDRSDVTSAEAFRQVLELYSIELNTGEALRLIPILLNWRVPSAKLISCALAVSRWFIRALTAPRPVPGIKIPKVGKSCQLAITLLPSAKGFESPRSRRLSSC